MSALPGADEQLLSVASAIADGVPVDWNRAAPDADATTTAVLDELRVIEGLSQLSDAVPAAWGPFAILGEIGHGSYGTVYRAVDPNLDLEVALKVIRPRPQAQPDPEKALSEARMLAQVRHDNVVRVFRAERVGAEVGLSMELVRGRTLQDLVCQQGPFSAKETMNLGVDICCALAAVHGLRMIHGDVKAQNVMRATGGRTVLMDFGAGSDVKTDDDAGRHRAGTPLYLAPEVFAGAVRTPVGDIYSAGVLLYFLATGTFPVEGLTGAEVRRQHEIGAPRRRLRDVRPDLPDAFIRVVERATAVRPEDRHQTAGELEADLNLALRQEGPRPATAPVPAPAPPPPPDPAPWFPRPLAIALVGVLAAIGLWFGYGRGARSAAPPTVASLERAAPAAAVPTPAEAPAEAPGDAYRIEAAFYRDEGGRSVRLAPGARVARGDRLSLQVLSSVPTYVYVVNEDDHGESYLLFPIPDLQTSNPLSAGARHEIPGAVDGTRLHWVVSSQGGREHFLIFASPEPLSPAFQRVFDSLPRPSANAPVLARPLNSDLVGVLRGVGGLARTPPAAAGPLRAEFGSPLPDGEETVRGVWVRQLTLDNPPR